MTFACHDIFTDTILRIQGYVSQVRLDRLSPSSQPKFSLLLFRRTLVF